MYTYIYIIILYIHNISHIAYHISSYIISYIQVYIISISILHLSLNFPQLPRVCASEVTDARLPSFKIKGLASYQQVLSTLQWSLRTTCHSSKLDTRRNFRRRKRSEVCEVWEVSVHGETGSHATDPRFFMLWMHTSFFGNTVEEISTHLPFADAKTVVEDSAEDT